jgi:pimeloyl-ACP methyl ester carboxylesterase
MKFDARVTFHVMLADMKMEISTDNGERTTGGRFRVDDFELEYSSRGTGEPLLFVHGGFLTSWFDPMSREVALSERYRLISYHRPGYGRSSLPSAPVTVEDQARCCVALLRHLRVERAHIVAHSIGGCFALQLALDAPDAVRSLALLEPPVMSAVTDLTGMQALREAGPRWQQGDTEGAVDLFMKGMVDPDYRKFFEDTSPDGLQEVLDGAKAFFTTDQPAVQAWKFSAAQAARITQPVLLVIGDGSERVNPIRSQVQRSLLAWLPNVQPFTLADATHLMPLQKPAELANALVDFYGRIG